jgi:hypothetical protein
MRLLCLILGMILSFGVLAQPNSESVSIGPGLDPSKVFPLAAKYRLPEFTTGHLITFDGKRSQNLTLNFNLFSEAPQFLDKNGDTLFLDTNLAEFIHLGTVDYFYDKDHYYEIIKNTEPIKLAIRRRWRVARIVSNNSVGERVGDAQVNTQERRGALVFSPALGKMVRNENTIYEVDLTYFLIDKNKAVHKANKASFLRLQKTNKAELESFLSSEKIDFNKEADLIYLVETISKGYFGK